MPEGLVTTPERRHPIPAEMRGRLRVWKREAENHYARLKKLVYDDRNDDRIADFVHRNTVKGRSRALRRLKQMFGPHAYFEGARITSDPLAVWVAFKPREAVMLEPSEPGLAQPCVTANYLIIDKCGIGDGLWTIEVFDHALGRVLQRSPGNNLTEILLGAHHAILRARLTRSVLNTIKGSRDGFLLPVGDKGAFVCTAVLGEDVGSENRPAVHVRAHTWIDENNIYENQQKLILEEGLQGERLGDSFLLPEPMRRPVDDSQWLVQFSEWAPGMPETM